MTRLGLATGLAAVALLSVAQMSMADSATYPMRGLIKSGSASGTGTTAATVLAAATAPSTATGSNKVLVLTQACFQVAAGTVTLTAGGISVPFTAANANGGTNCFNFSTGYVIPEGTDVFCAATGTNAFTCNVSGVVAKKK